MNNIEIDWKIAEAMGIFDHVSDGEFTDGKMEVMVIRKDDPTFCKIFRPTTNMSDAWEVFQFFDFDEIYRSLQTWVAMKYGSDEPVSVTAQSDESAAKAICLAALRVIERDKIDKKANI